MDSPLSGARWAALCFAPYLHASCRPDVQDSRGAPGGTFGASCPTPGGRPRRHLIRRTFLAVTPVRPAASGGRSLVSRPQRLRIAVELAVERLAVEAEDLCCPRPVSADRLHHAQDVAPLDLLQRD